MSSLGGPTLKKKKKTTRCHSQHLHHLHLPFHYQRNCYCKIKQCPAAVSCSWDGAVLRWTGLGSGLTGKLGRAWVGAWVGSWVLHEYMVIGGFTNDVLYYLEFGGDLVVVGPGHWGSSCLIKTNLMSLNKIQPHQWSKPLHFGKHLDYHRIG